MRKFPVFVLFIVIFFSTFATADVYTWVGGGDPSWNNPTNWTGGIDYPQYDSDKAIFPASTGGCTIGIPITIGELEVQPGYLDTIDFQQELTLANTGGYNGNLIIGDGNINYQAPNLTVAGDFTQTEGNIGFGNTAISASSLTQSSGNINGNLTATISSKNGSGYAIDLDGGFGGLNIIINTPESALADWAGGSPEDITVQMGPGNILYLDGGAPAAFTNLGNFTLTSGTVYESYASNTFDCDGTLTVGAEGVFGRASWTGAKEMGALVVNTGGTVAGGGSDWTINSETAGGQAIDIDGAISGTLNATITTPSTTQIDIIATSGYINDLIINSPGNSIQYIGGSSNITGDLTVTSGIFQYGSSTAHGFSTPGNAVVSNGGQLGVAPWVGAASFGSLTLDGGTYYATSGTTTLTSESSTGFIIERTVNGGTITPSGITNITYAGEGTIYMRSLSPSFSLGTVVVNNSGNIVNIQSAYFDNLTITSGTVRALNDGDGFHVSGIVNVSGTLGHNTWSFDPSFGNLIINSGGTYNATTGNTKVGGFANKGTFNPNGGTIYFEDNGGLSGFDGTPISDLYVAEGVVATHRGDLEATGIVLDGTLDSKAAGGLAFNGNDYVNCGTGSLGLTNGGSITMSAWVYPTTANQNGFIVQRAPVNTRWELFLEGGTLYLRGGATDNTLTDTQDLPLNKWSHVVGTINGTSGKLYVNGTNVANGTVDAIVDSSTAIEIGRHDAPAYYFNGYISDVRIFNAELSATNVQKLYAGTYDNTGLVGWWKLDEGTGIIAADSAGYDNNGTLGGDPAWYGPIIITGTITINATGEYKATLGTTEVGTSWTNNGIFTHNNGTVEAVDMTINASGDELNPFYNLFVDVGNTIRVVDGVIAYYTNTFTNNGTWDQSAGYGGDIQLLGGGVGSAWSSGSSVHVIFGNYELARGFSEQWSTTSSLFTLFGNYNIAKTWSENFTTGSLLNIVTGNYTRGEAQLSQGIDLGLTSGDIVVSDSTPTERDIIDINVTIHNWGDTQSGPFSSALYLDVTTPGSELVITPMDILPGESATMSTQWDTTGQIGSHSLIAIADYDMMITESNEENNTAEKEINVIAPGTTEITEFRTNFETANPDAVFTVYDENDQEYLISVLYDNQQYSFDFGMSTSNAQIRLFYPPAVDIQITPLVTDDEQSESFGFGTDIVDWIDGLGYEEADFAWVELNGMIDPNDFTARIELPQIYDLVYYCYGTEPVTCEVISTYSEDPNQAPCYYESGGKTYVYLTGYSGAGGALMAGLPPVSMGPVTPGILAVDIIIISLVAGLLFFIIRTLKKKEEKPSLTIKKRKIKATRKPTKKNKRKAKRR